MTERLKMLTGCLKKATLFADVGCDHGYCAEYMLKSGLCEKAMITDISAPSLQKAERLLASYINEGKCFSVVCDGLSGVPTKVDLVLIAGMGGMEIVHILSDGFIPRNFVLQPMRDSQKVRSLLIEKGAKIERDFTFFAENAFYDVITGSYDGQEKADERYTDAEREFGKENLRERRADFLSFLQTKIQKQRAVLQRDLNEQTKANAEKRLRFLQGVYDGEIK